MMNMNVNTKNEKKMIKQQILQHSKHMDTVMFHFINDNLKLDGLENRKEY